MLTDGELLAFYERSCDAVYRYASRLVGGDRARAEDLVQETYLTLVRQVRDGRRDPVDTGWAIATCRSRFLDQLRHAATVGRAEQQSRPAVLPNVDLGSADVLAHLPDDQRAALVLRYVDDMPVAAVAKAMGRGLHATESLLARARQAFRAAYEREDR